MRRQFPRVSTLLVLVLLASGVAKPLAAVEVTPAQQTLLRAAFDAVRAAGLSYQQQKFETAGKQLVVAMQKAGAGLQDADEETFTKAESILVQIERAHALLQLEGVVLPPFARPRFGEPWHDYAAALAAPPRRSRDQTTAKPDTTDAAGMGSASFPAAAGMEAEQDGISFVKQVAPLLVENCSGCHIDAMQIVGGLNMNSLAQLLRGGDSGPAVNAGDGDGSLLVRKLRGQEGQRMPAGGRPALTTESIQLISKWIDEGASLDSGGSPDQRLPVMVVEAWAKLASHQELATRRRELAIENWKLGASADSREQPTIVENKDVLVFGSDSEEQLEAFAQAASEALEQVLATLPKPRQKLDSGDAQVRGRITLFVFPRRYEYGEFSKMVEGRDLPAEWNVHWSYDGVDAYVSLVAPSEITKDTLAPRLIAPLASIQLAMRGSGPRWFREGLGRAVAAKLAGRDLPETQQWDAAIPAALRVVKKPKELIDERLPPAETDVLSYGIGKTLLDRSYNRELNRLLANLESGAPFDEAFATAFRVPLLNFVTTWFAYAANARGR